MTARDAAPTPEGCDCTTLCSMGPTCPGGMLAGLPGSGCARSAPTPEGVVLGAEEYTRDRMALYGYTPEQIKAAEEWPGHEASGCFYENWQWVCTDENGKPNHPDRDELEQTAEFVAWVLDREAARLAAERAAHEGLRAALVELADDFADNVDWSNGRSNYGDNEAWESAARQLRAALAAGVRGE